MKFRENFATAAVYHYLLMIVLTIFLANLRYVVTEARGIFSIFAIIPKSMVTLVDKVKVHGLRAAHSKHE